MVDATQKLNRIQSLFEDVETLNEIYIDIVDENVLNNFFADIIAISSYWKEYSFGIIDDKFIFDESKLRLQDTGKIFTGMEEKEPHYFISDIHGDLSQLLFSMLEAGVVKFKKDEQSVIFYDVKINKSYDNLEEFKNSITKQNRIDTDRESYIKKNLRILPNVKLDPEFDGTFIINGDLIDRALETEECLFLITKLLYETVEKNVWNGKERLIYIMGNHEAWFIDGSDFNVNTFILESKQEMKDLGRCKSDIDEENYKLHKKRKSLMQETLKTLTETGLIKACYLMPNGTIISHSVIDDDILCNIYNVKKDGRSDFLMNIDEAFDFQKREEFCDFLNENIRDLNKLSKLAEKIKNFDKSFFFSEEFNSENAPRFCQILGHRITESRQPEVLQDSCYKNMALMIDVGSNYKIDEYYNFYYSNDDGSYFNTNLILTSCVEGEHSFLMSSVNKAVCRCFMEEEVKKLRAVLAKELSQENSLLKLDSESEVLSTTCERGSDLDIELSSGSDISTTYEEDSELDGCVTEDMFEEPYPAFSKILVIIEDSTKSETQVSENNLSEKVTQGTFEGMVKEPKQDNLSRCV